MRKIKTFFIVAIVLLSAVKAVSAEQPKREFRSVWIATVANIDWPKTKGTSASVVNSQKSSLIAYLDRMQEMNLTTICFQVRSMCDAMYKSSYEPWSSYLTGTRGVDPGWDPLAFAVEECHKRGIECYAWVNPYRWSSTGTTSTWNTEFDNQVKSNGWLLTNGTFTVLNPGLAETRAHIVKVCKEIITNYGVEGLIFDDYFYPTGGTTEGSSAPDYQLWKNSGTTLSIGDWRRENVDKMVSDVYQMVQQTRPEVRFGIAPPGTAGASASKYGLTTWPNGYDTQYTSLYSDPLSWMSKGIVDFVSPQIYWHNDHSMAPFGKISNWWYGLAAHFKKCHCSVSINIYDLAQAMGYQEDLGNTQEHWAEHVENVLQQRTYAAANGVDAFGSNFYSIQYFTGAYSAHGDYVAQNCFPVKSLVPVVDWKKGPSYSAVSNLENESGLLSWMPVEDGLSTIRYTVYAVPTSVSKEKAITDDGFDVQYLQGITYAPSYQLASDKQSGYWYAVAVYDGYGVEHVAAIVDYPEESYGQKAQLVAPNDGAELEDEVEFSWIDGDEYAKSYTLQISAREDFSVIKYSQSIEATNDLSATVAASRIGLGKFYWRVVAHSSKYFDTPSDSRSFTITSMGVGEYEAGYTILTDEASYPETSDIEMESLWFRSVKTGYKNLSFADDAGVGSWNRDMVAVGEYVYISGRESNSSTAKAYLDRYNGSTGEYMGRLNLASDASVSFYPCNNLMKDSKGNVCISNLAMMPSSPIVIHCVDLNTGALTPVATLTSTTQPQGRFDHVAIIGDVLTGNFTVFGVVTNTSNIVKWKFVGGKSTEAMTSVTAHYPTSAGHFGLAPIVMPIAEDDVFVDGSNTALTRYNLSTSSRSGSFLANATAAPDDNTNSGATYFTLGDKTIVVYANSGPMSSPANTFSIVTTTDQLTFTDMSQLWVAPSSGLGNVDSGTYHAAADYVQLADNKVRLYLYVPGNGLCAYELFHTGYSKIEMINPETVVAPARYYNLQGIEISADNLCPGVYIVKQGSNVTKMLVK